MVQSVEREEYYNYALGKTIKSKTHLRNELAKLRGQGKEMIEIGDEKPEKIERHFALERKEKRDKRWAEPVEKLAQDVAHGR